MAPSAEAYMQNLKFGPLPVKFVLHLQYASTKLSSICSPMRIDLLFKNTKPFLGFKCVRLCSFQI
jgi:hypothetical protein